MSYSWGSDTSGSWGGGSSGGSSGGYSYSSARSGGGSSSSSSSCSSGRTYSGGSSSGSSCRSYSRAGLPVKGKKLETNSTSPLVVAIDVTGSMSEWPATFFEKLPLLYNEVKRYLPDVEISFAAIGDATCDSVPLQAGKFDKGKALDDVINSLYPEGGGGGGARESYELMAHFYVNNVEIPKAKKPIFIFAGDEGFYDRIDQSLVSRYIGDSGQTEEDSFNVMRSLCQKFDTYILRKDYGSGAEETKIKKQWQKALGGSQRVMKLDDPRRIVDCIIGVVAASVGKFGDYTTRLSVRQTEDQVASVMKSIGLLGDGSKAAMKGKTILALPSGKKSKGL